jgi:hypothetical protein
MSAKRLPVLLASDGDQEEAAQEPLVALRLSYTWHLLAPSTKARTM